MSGVNYLDEALRRQLSFWVGAVGFADEDLLRAMEDVLYDLERCGPIFPHVQVMDEQSWATDQGSLKP